LILTKIEHFSKVSKGVCFGERFKMRININTQSAGDIGKVRRKGI